MYIGFTYVHLENTHKKTLPLEGVFSYVYFLIEIRKHVVDDPRAVRVDEQRLPLDDVLGIPDRGT